MAFTGPALPHSPRAPWCPAQPAQGPTLSHTSHFHLLAWGQPGSPRPCMHHAGHRSQLTDLPCPTRTPGTPMTGPTPLGPLVETGAPCSEAVLLRGIIKRPEDVGAQALSEWSRLSWNWGNWTLRHPHASSLCTYQAHPGMLPTGISCRSRTAVAAPAPMPTSVSQWARLSRASSWAS